MSAFQPKQKQSSQRTSSTLAAPGVPARVTSQQEQSHLNLQRTIGNQAMLRLMRADAAPVRGMQRKLTVNTPGDAFEQEADHVADQVMRMSDPSAAAAPAVSGGVAGVQRACACGGTCSDCQNAQHHEHAHVQMKAAPGNAGGMEAPPIVHEVLRSPGQPLDATTRAFMEPRFGHDFSGVRVHSDARAAESASAVQARAYTVGRDVVFGAGEFAAGTQAGQRLLGHELTHVVQQAGQTISPIAQRQPKPEPDAKDEPETNVVDPREFAKAESLARIRRACDLPKLSQLGIKAEDHIDAQTAQVLDVVRQRASLCGSLSQYITLSSQSLSQGHFNAISHYGGAVPGSSGFYTDDYNAKVLEFLKRTEGTTFTGKSEKEQQKEISETGGFYERKDDTVNVPSDGMIGSALHEVVHRGSKKFLQNVYGHDLNEAVTQCMADIILHDEGLSPFSKQTYNLSDARRLISKVGLDLVARVYFEGDPGAHFQILDKLGLVNRPHFTPDEILAAIRK